MGGNVYKFTKISFHIPNAKDGSVTEKTYGHYSITH